MAQDEEDMNANDENMEGGEDMSDERSYEQSDVETLYGKSDFSSWDEIVDWLEKNAENDMDISEDKAKAMAEDFKKLRDDGVEFTKDPAEAFGLVQEEHAETMK